MISIWLVAQKEGKLGLAETRAAVHHAAFNP